jgi:hypothetical protein
LALAVQVTQAVLLEQMAIRQYLVLITQLAAEGVGVHLPQPFQAVLEVVLLIMPHQQALLEFQDKVLQVAMAQLMELLIPQLAQGAVRVLLEVMGQVLVLAQLGALVLPVQLQDLQFFMRVAAVELRMLVLE